MTKIYSAAYENCDQDVSSGMNGMSGMTNMNCSNLALISCTCYHHADLYFVFLVSYGAVSGAGRLGGADTLTDCVDTLIAFEYNSLSSLSMPAIHDLDKISQYLFGCDTYSPDNMFLSNTIQQQQQSHMFESELHNSIVSSMVGKNADMLRMLS